jgi:diguanylate cyclase (GGDEF)-like protein
MGTVETTPFSLQVRQTASMKVPGWQIEDCAICKCSFSQRNSSRRGLTERIDVRHLDVRWSALRCNPSKCNNTNSYKPHRYHHALEQLITVTQELSCVRSLESMMTIVRTVACDLIGADGATLVLRNQDLYFPQAKRELASVGNDGDFPIKPLSSWVMLHQQPAIMTPINTLKFACATLRSVSVKSVAMVPVKPTHPIGALGVYWVTSHHPEPEEIKILEAMAKVTATALETIQKNTALEQCIRDRTKELEQMNQRLLKEIQERQEAEVEIRLLSLTDELTKLYNRRGFFLLTEQQLKLAHRRQTPCCLLFIDLDGLKQVNDTWGHSTGDRLIIDAARLLTDTFRSSDLVCRLGGDEFAVLISDCSNVEDVFARLHTNITTFNQTADRLYSVSMSIGAKCFTPSPHLRLEQLIARADELMYACKRSKQNAAKVQSSQPDQASPDQVNQWLVYFKRSTVFSLNLERE